MQKNRKSAFLLLALVLVISLFTGCSSSAKNKAPISIPIPTYVPQATPSTTPEAPTEQTSESTSSEDSPFEIHFLDVGQADAALVLCDGHAMLIDGGNSEDSNMVYAYLRDMKLDYLDYIVATHGHEDHVGGLSGALNYARVGTAYSPVADYDSEAFSDFQKYLDSQGISITIPEVGSYTTLGSARVEFLAPIHITGDPNNDSLVLRIVYGDTSFLFTGDAEREEEQDILDSGCTVKSTLLKVGHHGSENATSYPFLYAVEPDYAVISVGSDNNYGHPTEEALSRLRDADVTVYRTDMQGTIICRSDGQQLTFTTERNENADTLALPTPKPTSAPTPEPTPEPTEAPLQESTVSETMVWIPQSGSKYHSNSSCSNMKNPSRVTLSDAVAWGYEPCKKCY